MTRNKLSLSGKTTDGKKIYVVEQVKAKVRAAGGTNEVFEDKSTFPVETARSKAKNRASRLGVKIHSTGRKGNYRGEKKFTNEDSVAQASGNVVQENINTVQYHENEYFGNVEQSQEVQGNLIDDDMAIQQANILTVLEQHHSTDDPQNAGTLYTGQNQSGPNHSRHAQEAPKERKRGTGFLGRNNRRAKRQESHYA